MVLTKASLRKINIVHINQKSNHQEFSLQGIVIDRGSSARPATVTSAVKPHSRQTTEYVPTPGAGHGTLREQNFSPGLAMLISTPSGNLGLAGCVALRPLSLKWTSIVIFRCSGLGAIRDLAV